MVSSYTKLLEPKRFNSHRTGLGHQHDSSLIVLGHQYGCRNAMWKHCISSIPNVTAIPQLVSALTNLLKYRTFLWEEQHTMWTQLLTGHFYNVYCLVVENMCWMSCCFEEAKECTWSLSKQPCYQLGHKVKFFVICFVLLLITVSTIFVSQLNPALQCRSFLLPQW